MMFYKFTAFLLMFLTLTQLCARERNPDMAFSYQRAPIIRLTNGNIDGFVGHDITVTTRQNLTTQNGMLKFNGKDSYLKLTIPWMFPETQHSMTFVVDFTLDSYDTHNGILVGREGWHHSLRVRNDGKLIFGCFSLDGKQEKYIISRKRLELGRLYRAAGVLDLTPGNKTILSLYLDGELEGTAEIPMMPFLYRREINLGGIKRLNDGSVKSPLPCSIKNFYMYYEPLTLTQICRIPGFPGKEKWTIYKPLLHARNINTTNSVTRKTFKPFRGSYTMAARVVVHKIPASGNCAILHRPGYGSSLGVHADGSFFFGGWNEEKNCGSNIHSTEKVIPGKEYFVVGVAESRQVETIFSLFINGKLVGRKAVTGKVYPYNEELFFGGFQQKNGSEKYRLDCNILDGYLYGIALSDTEVEALR